MHPPTGYIEIDRRFSRLHPSDRPEELAPASYLGGSLADSLTLGWTELLKERLVVILGEPGSGKSWEFRTRCASLQKKGEDAFLIELERLVAGTFEALLAPSDMERFQKWQCRGQTAWFFLDSVDEAKIRRSADFYAALDKVVAAIGGALDRTCVLISSRISEWRPETDRKEVLGRFVPVSPPQQPEASESGISVVQIVPFDRNRVRTFAARSGIGNPDQFLAALDNHSAWEFARRPLDVFDLASFWMTHGRLGSLTEIIEHDVTTKLRETVERRVNFPLSQARAREGAEWLAAATLFCKQQQFKVPDETFLAQAGLDATNCLPENWEPGEVAALLSRPLFESATYGQIRFHHRRVSEYLAAQWICSRMAEGCPTRNLLQLLFDDAPGTPAPRDTLIPVLAWLCNGNERWNDEVRRWVLRGAPEIHLEYGDAEALPLQFKRAFLESWIQRNSGREEAWSRYSPDALRRLADQCLAPDVARFLGDKATPVNIRELLVQLVRYGRLTACIPNLIEILGCLHEPEDLKTYVLAALRDMGTPESHRQAWEILRTAPALTNQMRTVACESLFPDTIGAADLALLLEKPDVREEHFGSLQHAIERLVEERLTADHAGALIVELNRLLQIAPHIKMEEKETRISSRYVYLLAILPLALNRLLSGPVTEAECGLVAKSLSLIAETQPFNDSHNEHYESLDNATAAHPCVRQCFFWDIVERHRAAKANNTSCFLVIYEFQKVLNLSVSDLEWMIPDIQNRPDHADRLLALRIAIELLTRRGDRRLTRVEVVVSTDPELASVVRLARSDVRWQWFRRLRYRWSDIASWRHWWAMKRISLSRKWIELNDRWWLFRNANRLRSGEAIKPLFELCHEARNDVLKFTPSNWNALAKARGRKIADAVKEGCKRSWRKFVPPLPHEKSIPGQVDGQLMIGLAGIQSMIVDGQLSFDSTSDADIRLITRYAVQEMNGFPTWLAGLANARPAPVAEVLTECVHGEWQYPATRERYNDVLAGISWAGGCLAQLVRPAVIESFRAGDPEHPGILDSALSLVVKTTTLPDAELGEIAARRSCVLPLDSEAFVMWAAVCLLVNADQAISIIEKRLRDYSGADDFVLRLSEVLGSDVRPRLPFVVQPDYLRPATLVRLIPFVYRHVRPEDDIDRAHKGPYTPTARDNASRFRTGLLSLLAQSDDPGAIATMQRLRTCPELSAHHDWLLHLIDQRIVADADYAAWEPAALREFARLYETEPRTDTELFQIVLNRLTDIKDDVEHSDNSLREEVKVDAKESVLRRWLARKLNERSRERYTVPQEQEIDQEERPDLRVENPHTEPVSIELKWADNWTLDKLLERLENQLVGQYLRAHNSRYGIYLLATDGRKGHWESPDGNLIFDQVIERVARRAEELKRTRPCIGDLRLVSIDFRVPAPG